MNARDKERVRRLHVALRAGVPGVQPRSIKTLMNRAADAEYKFFTAIRTTRGSVTKNAWWSHNGNIRLIPSLVLHVAKQLDVAYALHHKVTSSRRSLSGQTNGCRWPT